MAYTIKMKHKEDLFRSRKALPLIWTAQESKFINHSIKDLILKRELIFQNIKYFENSCVKKNLLWVWPDYHSFRYYLSQEFGSAINLTLL